MKYIPLHGKRGAGKFAALELHGEFAHLNEV
jgi:hypothetical protein